MRSFEQESLRYCRWLTRRSGSHFATAIRLLPGPRRREMEALYAFCRAVDDVADREGNDPEEAARELNRWRRELAACFEGTPTHPIGAALRPVVERHRIPLRYFEQVIEGVEMDLRPRRYATFEELKGYCERVASAVGLISVRLFGCRHPGSDRYAVNLGIALQLTNILRDVKQDALRGRLYLPLEDLARFGCSEPDLAAGRASEPFRRMMAFEWQRARSFFSRAETDLRESGEGGRLFPARIMGGVYGRLLEKIRRMEYDVFSRRISVPLSEQLWVVARCALGGPAGGTGI